MGDEGALVTQYSYTLQTSLTVESSLGHFLRVDG